MEHPCLPSNLGGVSRRISIQGWPPAKMPKLHVKKTKSKKDWEAWLK
jgi:hypothetical protein